MMRCNLSILLAERNLKITKVSNDTGISRTTLTSLYYNYAKGIQFDTFNTLCNYLKTTPNALISYIPVEITIDTVWLNDVHISIKHNNIFKPFILYLDVYKEEEGIKDEKEEDAWVRLLDISVGLYEAETDEEIKEQEIILNAFHQLTTPFLTDLESIITNEVYSATEFVNERTEIIFTWLDGLDEHG